MESNDVANDLEVFKRIHDIALKCAHGDHDDMTAMDLLDVIEAFVDLHGCGDGCGDLKDDPRFTLRWGITVGGHMIAAFVARDRAEQLAAMGRLGTRAEAGPIEVVELTGRATRSLPERW